MGPADDLDHLVRVGSQRRAGVVAAARRPRRRRSGRTPWRTDRAAVPSQLDLDGIGAHAGQVAGAGRWSRRPGGAEVASSEAGLVDGLPESSPPAAAALSASGGDGAAVAETDFVAGHLLDAWVLGEGEEYGFSEQIAAANGGGAEDAHRSRCRRKVAGWRGWSKRTRISATTVDRRLDMTITQVERNTAFGWSGHRTPR